MFSLVLLLLLVKKKRCTYNPLQSKFHLNVNSYISDEPRLQIFTSVFECLTDITFPQNEMKLIEFHLNTMQTLFQLNSIFWRIILQTSFVLTGVDNYNRSKTATMITRKSMLQHCFNNSHNVISNGK